MSNEEPKLASVTMKWVDGSSLTFTPSEWDSYINHLILTAMMEDAGLKPNATFMGGKVDKEVGE